MRAGGSRTFRSMRVRVGALLQRALILDLAARTGVFVAGSGRSGTTWLMELINSAGDHRCLFEPFRGDRVPQAGALLEDHYLPPDETPSPAVVKAVRRIFQGALRHPSVDLDTPPGLYLRRLIKDIRANLMLGWLARQYLHTRFVLILRDPLATVRSQARLGWPAHDVRTHYLVQSALVRDWLSPHLGLLRSLETDTEMRLASWCIQNRVPLSQLPSDRLHVVSYERLCETPEVELAALWRFLGLPRPPSGLQVERPSRATWSTPAHAQPLRLTGRCERLLEAFGFAGADRAMLVSG